MAAVAGCHSLAARGRWCECQPPSLAQVKELHERARRANADCGTRRLLAAVEAESSDQPRAAAYYYSAALSSARCIEQADLDDRTIRIASQVHDASLKSLLCIADSSWPGTAGGSLTVAVDGRLIPIAVSLHGFAWRVADVQRLHVVGSYQTDALTCVRRRPGVGVPLVLQRTQRTGEHCEERFFPERSTFAATAVLRPTAPNDAGFQATLELYNPHAVGEVELGGRRVPLAADTSAPLAYQAIHEATRTNPVAWFLNPGAATGNEGLYFLEPYQSGKIPVVFVHGLLSSPSTWTDMVNELRATPGFDEHYQIWAYRYATGGSFLRAAAQLRRALYEAVETADPRGEDAALRSIVLVGHSMGGLVSKLQAVESRDVLWRAVARRPFDQIAADEATRREFAEVLFFEPQPSVRRVVFLAVPHGGSSWAARPVGRIASAVVQLDDGRNMRYSQIVAANPGAFAPEFERRLPTSIDMLEPENPLLQAVRSLPLAGHVHANSVIGTGGMLSPLGRSDGIVPVESARHGQVESETLVDANHERVHRHADTVGQIRAILSQHLAEHLAQPPPVSTTPAVGKRAVVVSVLQDDGGN